MAAVDWLSGDRITATKLLAMEVGHLIIPSSPTTISNTTTETEYAEFTIPANTAAVGDCWRMQAWGIWGNTGTPTLNWKLRVGASTTASSNTQQAQTGALTTQSGVSNRLWMAELLLVCESIGATGTVNGPMKVKTAGILAGTAPFINDTAEITTAIDGTSSTTIDTTVANYVSFTATWSAASSSNTFICRGFTAQKLIG